MRGPLGFAQSNETNAKPLTPRRLIEKLSDFVGQPPFNASDIVAPNLKLRYLDQMNVAIQQQLGAEQSLTVGYMGAVGKRLVNDIALHNNLVNPDTFNFGLLVYGNYSNSNYSALQAQFQTQFSHGLGALASYTWGHSTDTASNFNQLATLSIGNAGPPETVRGASSDFDVRQTIGFSLIYEIPTPFAKAGWHGCSRWGLFERKTTTLESSE